MKRYIILVLAVLFFGAINAQSYKVVVNPSNPVTSISKKDLANIFLKKKSKWESGTKITPIDQSSKSLVRKDFSTSVLNKSVGAVKSYWQQYVFAGKGTPPVEKKTDAEVIEYVKSHSGAIGYVSNKVSTSGVKVINVN